MRGTAVDGHLERPGPLPAGLQQPAVGRRLEHQHGAAGERPLLDERPRLGRTDLLVGAEQELHAGPGVECRQAVEGLHDPAEHVEHTGPGGPAVDDRRTDASASVPAGNTVSWWPSSSTFGSPPPDQCTCGPAGLSTSDAVPPSRRSMIAASTSAEADTASTSSDGDSTSTNSRRSASIVVDREVGPASGMRCTSHRSPPATVIPRPARWSGPARLGLTVDDDDDRPSTGARRVPARPSGGDATRPGGPARRTRSSHPGLATRGGGDARRRVAHLVHVARTGSAHQRLA